MINASFASVHLCRKWDVLMRVGGLQKDTIYVFFLAWAAHFALQVSVDWLVEIFFFKKYSNRW